MYQFWVRQKEEENLDGILYFQFYFFFFLGLMVVAWMFIKEMGIGLCSLMKKQRC